METKLKMVYWKGKKFWVGKLIDHPEVMTQGKTLKELENNIIDAYKLLVLDEVPEDHENKEIAVAGNLVWGWYGVRSCNQAF